MSLFFSTSLILDLYQLLHNPFQSSEKRLKKYIVNSVLGSVFLSCSGLYMTKSKIFWVSELNFRFYQGVAVTNLVVAVVVMILVLLRFRNKGMNENIKQQI